LVISCLRRVEEGLRGVEPLGGSERAKRKTLVIDVLLKKLGEMETLRRAVM
jgi:hypothetical protein